MKVAFFHIYKKKLLKVIAVVLLIAVTFAMFLTKKSEENPEWVSVSTKTDEEPKENSAPKTEAQEELNTQIIVDIAGEVEKPSVYILSTGSRVYEGIEAAGGLTKAADTRFINQAAPLTDGTKLYIPSKEEAEEIEMENPPKAYGGGESSSYAGSPSKSTLININTADSQMLQQLPRIGPATAEKIIAYRNEFGKFKRNEELMNVSGIGEKTFEALKNLITVE